MRTAIFPVFFIGFAMMFSSQAMSANNPYPSIETITGDASSCTLVRGKKTLALKEGDALKNGDIVQTGATTSARLVYSDNTQLFVGRGSSVKIQARDKVTPWVYLEKGQIRSVVAKTDKPAPKKNYRYGVSGKTIAMGVRGTDFTVDTDEKGDSSKVHALDGNVEVAGKEKDLFKGAGQVLQKDHLIESQFGKLQNPVKFNPDDYLQQLKQKQPDFQNFIAKPPRSIQELNQLKNKPAEALQKGTDLKKQIAPPEIKKPELPKPEIKKPEGLKLPKLGG